MPENAYYDCMRSDSHLLMNALGLRSDTQRKRETRQVWKNYMATRLHFSCGDLYRDAAKDRSALVSWGKAAGGFQRFVHLETGGARGGTPECNINDDVNDLDVGLSSPAPDGTQVRQEEDFRVSKRRRGRISKTDKEMLESKARSGVWKTVIAPAQESGGTVQTVGRQTRRGNRRSRNNQVGAARLESF
ncbi:hypothetical protein B0H19DRAFT_1062068 [Mycena capillaripes]|nr:hypothetical protein B0H19DRAFT_1062068 [Mycena capillaripes]